MNRGNLWLIAKQYDNAIEDYDRAMELEVAKLHVALMNKGIAFESKGDLFGAKELYQAALEKRQDWPSAQLRLERILSKIAKSQKS